RSALLVKGIVSPVLKIPRLGLPLQLSRHLLDQFRAFRGWHVAHGMAEHTVSSGRQRHGDLVLGDSSLSPARYQCCHLLLQSDEGWGTVIMWWGVGRGIHVLFSQAKGLFPPKDRWPLLQPGPHAFPRIGTAARALDHLVEIPVGNLLAQRERPLDVHLDAFER